MNRVELGWIALCWVAVLGACSGLISVAITRRWSNPEGIRAAGNAMVAHLMEFRLFPDEPISVLRAQRDLIKANGRLLRALLVPAMLTAIPFSVLLGLADSLFSHASLQVGVPAVITARFRGELPDSEITVPSGFVLETQPVRVFEAHEMSWRVRPAREASGSLKLLARSQVMQRSISSKHSITWDFEKPSWLPSSWLGGPANLEWIRIQYPKATVLGCHWALWFSIAACSGAAVAVRHKVT